MVKRGIEDFLLFAIGGFDADARKLALPGVMSRLANAVKIPIRNFGFEIFQRCFCADAGEAGFDEDHFSRRSLVANDTFEVLTFSLFGPGE